MNGENSSTVTDFSKSENSTKMQSYSTSDLVGGKWVLLVLVALIIFMVGSFLVDSLKSGWKNQKTAGNVQGRFGSANWASKQAEVPKP